MPVSSGRTARRSGKIPPLNLKGELRARLKSVYIVDGFGKWNSSRYFGLKSSLSNPRPRAKYKSTTQNNARYVKAPSEINRMDRINRIG